MFVWYLKGKRLGDQQIDTIRGERKVIVFGTLERDKRLSRLLDEVGKSNILCIFEPDPTRWGTEFEGIPVLQPVSGMDVLMVSSDIDWIKVERQAREFGYDRVHFYLTEEKQKLLDAYLDEYLPLYSRNLLLDAKFKYVHFMPASTHFHAVAEMIEHGLDVREHFFIIYDLSLGYSTAASIKNRIENWMEQYHNIYLIHTQYPIYPFYPNNWEGDRDKFDRLLGQANKIIFHGEFGIQSVEDYLAEKLDLIKEKGVWLPWSAMVFPRRIEFVEKILQYVKLVVLGASWMKGSFLSRFPELRSAQWVEGAGYARITEKPKRHVRKGKAKRILISHSASAVSNAAETIDLLTEIDEAFDVYALLSYGSSEEAEHIEAYGAQKLGARFVAIKEFMKYDEFVEFLSTIDVAVFGMQEAFGRDTMELLLWLGAKLFLKPESDAWKRMESSGYRLADYYTIKNLTAEELLNDPHKEWNQKLAGEREFDVEKKVQQWRAVFEYDWGDPT